MRSCHLHIVHIDDLTGLPTFAFSISMKLFGSFVSPLYLYNLVVIVAHFQTKCQVESMGQYCLFENILVEFLAMFHCLSLVA